MMTKGSDSKSAEPATAGDRMEVVGELAGTTITSLPESLSEVKSRRGAVCKFTLTAKDNDSRVAGFVGDLRIQK